MILDYGKPDSRLVWGECFCTRQKVQSRGGAIVGGVVNGPLGQGIQPTSAATRVTFNRTEDMLINASEMTIEMRLKTSALGGAANQTIVAKCPNALNDNQFLVTIAELGGVYVPYLFIAASAADAANYGRYATGLTQLTEYMLHAVYKGSAAAGSRIVWYVNGDAVVTSIVGTIPTSMRASNSKLGCPNYPDGTLYSIGLGGCLRQVNIYREAFDATACKDAYKQQTFQRVFGP